jgi:hypothetical protein
MRVGFLYNCLDLEQITLGRRRQMWHRLCLRLEMTVDVGEELAVLKEKRVAEIEQQWIQLDERCDRARLSINHRVTAW